MSDEMKGLLAGVAAVAVLAVGGVTLANAVGGDEKAQRPAEPELIAEPNEGAEAG